MSTLNRIVPVFVLAGCSAASVGFIASAQVCDDFESYTAGKEVVPQSDGVWEWWCGDWQQGPIVVDDHAYSGTKSLRMTPNDDIVHVVTGAQNTRRGERLGTWILRAMTYFSSEESGQVYFIALNEYFDEYGDCAPVSWPMQVLFDLDTGVVTAVFSGNETTPLIYDEWVEFRAVVDLHADVHDIYYGDNLFVNDRPWSSANGEPSQLECINLFSNNGFGWYDDVAAIQEEFYCFGEGELICPASAIIHRGIETGSEFSNVCNSDNSDWSFQPDALAATVVAPIRVELTGNTTIDAPSKVSFNLETAATHDGVAMKVELWNYTTNAWVGTVFPDINNIDDEIYSVVKDTNATDYISNTGEVKAQISYLRPLGVPPFWNISIDTANWLVE